MSRYREIDIQKVKSVSIRQRESKVRLEDMARPVDPDCSFRTFMTSLPGQLAGKDFISLVEKIVQAHRSEKPVLLMMGAHVIKVGLSAVIIDLLRSGLLKGIALNGAGAIHDVELAYFGKTSEDVASALKDGSFGMAKETAEILNTTAAGAVKETLGFGEALGKRICTERPANFSYSILGEAYSLGVPVTVHVAIGTDIVHQHASADGASIGEASIRDFRIWAELVAGIGGGGVVLLFGSSVILPEVFLKALTVARNIRGKVDHFTTADFDMIRHYRPRVNVVERPTQDGGTGFHFTGHHEIMMPLLVAAVKALS